MWLLRGPAPLLRPLGEVLPAQGRRRGRERGGKAKRQGESRKKKGGNDENLQSYKKDEQKKAERG